MKRIDNEDDSPGSVHINGLMRMWFAGAAQAAGAGLASASGGGFIARDVRGEDRQLLAQPRGTAMRTGSALPLSRTHQQFAVALAFLTMKLVNRHGGKVAGAEKSSSRNRLTPCGKRMDTQPSAIHA